MKKSTKKIISLLSVLFLLIGCASLFSYAEDAAQDKEIKVSHIEIKRDDEAEGTLFSGSFKDAVINAGDNGTVIVYGSVETEPLSENAGVRFSNITIEGRSINGVEPYVGLTKNYIPKGEDKEMLYISGAQITVKNVTFDASHELKQAITIAPSASDITLDGVAGLNGNIGCITVRSAKNITIKNTLASGGQQCGFFITGTGNASDLSFTDCKTAGSIVENGVIVSDMMGAATNVSLSGIKCHEGVFAIKDYNKKPGQISIKAAPVNKDDKAIKTDKAAFRVIGGVEYIRFGLLDDELITTAAKLSTARYGISTTICFDSVDQANSLAAGETVEKVESPKTDLWSKIRQFFAMIARFFMNMWMK